MGKDSAEKSSTIPKRNERTHTHTHHRDLLEGNADGWLEDKHTSLGLVSVLVLLAGTGGTKAAPDPHRPPSLVCTYFLLGTGNSRLSTPQINVVCFLS